MSSAKKKAIYIWAMSIKFCTVTFSIKFQIAFLTNFKIYLSVSGLASAKIQYVRHWSVSILQKKSIIIKISKFFKKNQSFVHLSL